MDFSRLDELNKELQTCKELISTKEALDRLKTNKDFITIIINGYLRDYSYYIVTNKHSIENSDKILDSIYFLNKYFNDIETNASIAENDMFHIQEEISSIGKR